MTFHNYFIQPLKNVFNYSGRATRKEYGFFLLSLIIMIALFGILMSFSVPMGKDMMAESKASTGEAAFFTVLMIFMLVLVLTHISMLVRRLHDTGRSGWFALILLVPVVQYVLIAYCLFVASVPEDNQWGAYRSVS